MENQFIKNELNHAIVTYDTLLSLEVQSIECVIFTFDLLSDELLRFFLPYVNENTEWKMMPMFRTHEKSYFRLPVNQNMFDFIHHVQMIENGCSMREAERSLNIDSYEFEKIIKFLKGRRIIKKEGLNYVIDNLEGLPAIETIEFDTTSSLSVAYELVEGKSETIPDNVMFKFSSKKIMPVGWYEFAIIPEDLKHKEGLICASQWSNEGIISWCQEQGIDTLLIGSRHEDLIRQLEKTATVITLQLDQNAFLGGNNPYQKVMRAKNTIEKYDMPKLNNSQKIGLVLDHYDEGWSVNALCIVLKSQHPAIEIFPLCLSF
jgi:hypothetical protein